MWGVVTKQRCFCAFLWLRMSMASLITYNMFISIINELIEVEENPKCNENFQTASILISYLYPTSRYMKLDLVQNKPNLSFHSFIHSFRPFLQRLFKFTSTQKRSRYSTDTVPGVSRRSATGNCELRTCPRSLPGG